MNTNQKTVLNLIETVYVEAKNSKLDFDNLRGVNSEIESLSTYFNVSPSQVVLLCSILGISGANETYVHQLANYLDLENLQFLNHLTDIKVLEEKSILMKNRRRSRHVSTMMREEYILSPHLLNYVIENKPIPKELLEGESKEDTFIQFLFDLDELRQEKTDNQIDFLSFTSDVEALVLSNRHFKMVDYVLRNKMTQLEYCVFFDVIFDTINAKQHGFVSGLQATIDDFSSSKKTSISFINEFLAERTQLNTLKLVEKKNDKFINDFRLKLSPKAIALLKEYEQIEIHVTVTEKSNVIRPEKIKKLPLFYNANEKLQIESITKSLGKRAFLDLQKQLQSVNMPRGISCLLHGTSGTGKTETVYQIARKTNRAVMFVDISETKSMWFGESQKLVKRIFSDYYALQKSEENCPILLFNEADSVIGKRKNAGSSSVADTENAIQNILLEELECFSGIVFATTNLIGNLDAAFERRFLFKVNFEIPDLECSAKIWKTKLPFLSARDCKTLANSFQFSGGEMENIARKCILEQVIHGKLPNLDLVMHFCSQEKWGSKSSASSIGFIHPSKSEKPNQQNTKTSRKIRA